MTGVGPRLDGRYDLLEPLGDTLWLGHDRARGMPVVVRVGVTLDRETAQRLSRLSHPGIAGVRDVGAEAAGTYLVGELVSGRSLRTVVNERGRLPGPEIMDIVAQVAFALDAFHHAGLCHGRVGPDAVLIRDDGVVKLSAVAPPAGGPPESDLRALGRLAADAVSPAASPQVLAVVDQLVSADRGTRPAELARSALALAAAAPPPAASMASPAAPSRRSIDPQTASAAPPAATAVDDAERRRVRNRLIAVGVFVVLAGLVVLRLVGGGHGATATVPRAVGRPYPQAAMAVRQVGLVPRERTAPPAAGQRIGVVVAQSAAAGSRIKAGSTVTLTVAVAGATSAPSAGGGHGG